MSVMNFVKEHPYMSAGGVFVIGAVLVVILFSGDDGAAPVTGTVIDNTSTVAANTQLAMMQLQGQVQMAGINAEASNNAAAIAASLKIAELENTRGARADELASAVAQSQITANRETQTLVSTLSAQVAQSQIDATTRQAEIQSATATQLATIQANNMRDLTSLNTAAQLAMAQQYGQMVGSIITNQTQRDIELARIDANKDITLGQQHLTMEQQRLDAQKTAQVSAIMAQYQHANSMAATMRAESQWADTVYRKGDGAFIRAGTSNALEKATSYSHQAAEYSAQADTFRRQLAGLGVTV